VFTGYAEIKRLKEELGGEGYDVVGRRRFTVSTPVLKAPMVSALETTIS